MILLLVACDPTGSGTSIGNPNRTLLRVAPGGDVELTSAELDLIRVVLDGPEGQQILEGPFATDVLEGVELDLPTGEWTSLTLTAGAPFALLGDAGGSVDLTLDVPEVGVQVDRGPLLDGQPHVFELASPGWLDASVVGWDLGVDQVVTPDGPLHARLAEAITAGSALWPDADGDGEPDR
ncbi:MAG: hypothetical protein H6736_21280 [Alphaproteobacteria bacterium]|nr:hypothetical protein [Alphaproteobacteria bacterium]MCB9694350.1 hypothetical protein [Alphaproteobacteria bacterium]